MCTLDNILGTWSFQQYFKTVFHNMAAVCSEGENWQQRIEDEDENNSSGVAIRVSTEFEFNLHHFYRAAPTVSQRWLLQMVSELDLGHGIRSLASPPSLPYF